MYSKFPFSMENIPQQKSFVGFSLKVGCIFSALLIILYSVFAIAQCALLLSVMSAKENKESAFSYIVVIAIGLTHFVTMFFTTVMLVGTIRDKHQLMKPWIIWTSCQIIAYLLMFFFLTTMIMINYVETSLVAYVIDFLALLVRFYMLVLVSSYSKELEEEDGYEKIKRLALDETRYSVI